MLVILCLYCPIHCFSAPMQKTMSSFKVRLIPHIHIYIPNTYKVHGREQILNKYGVNECVYHMIFLKPPLMNYSDSRLVLITQSCLTFCKPMDSSPPGYYVHGILQARILKWVAISFSRFKVGNFLINWIHRININ